MDPRLPPVPSPATHTQSPAGACLCANSSSGASASASGHTSPADTDCDFDSEYVYSEKDDAAASQLSARHDRGSSSTHGRAHDSLFSPFSPKPSAPSSPGSSISSDAGRKHPSLTDARRSHHSSRHPSCPPRAHLGDPEKAASYDAYEQRSQRSQQRTPAPDAVVYDKSSYHEQGPEDKAWQLLFYLSGPCALLSIAITLWTLLATLLALVLYPLRFCTSRPALSTQLTTFLAPALNLQLHLVYSFDASEAYSVPMLLVIHLFSPVVAFGVAIASWTAAGFWFFSSILGDPGGHDGGRHNDGKDSILGVRNYWERWLSRGLR